MAQYEGQGSVQQDKKTNWENFDLFKTLNLADAEKEKKSSGTRQDL